MSDRRGSGSQVKGRSNLLAVGYRLARPTIHPPLDLPEGVYPAEIASVETWESGTLIAFELFDRPIRVKYFYETQSRDYQRKSNFERQLAYLQKICKAETLRALVGKEVAVKWQARRVKDISTYTPGKRITQKRIARIRVPSLLSLHDGVLFAAVMANNDLDEYDGISATKAFYDYKLSRRRCFRIF